MQTEQAFTNKKAIFQTFEFWTVNWQPKYACVKRLKWLLVLRW